MKVPPLYPREQDVDETQTVTLGLNSSEVSTREEELERVQYRYCTDPVVAGVRVLKRSQIYVQLLICQ